MTPSGVLIISHRNNARYPADPIPDIREKDRLPRRSEPLLCPRSFVAVNSSRQPRALPRAIKYISGVWCRSVLSPQQIARTPTSSTRARPDETARIQRAPRARFDAATREAAREQLQARAFRVVRPICIIPDRVLA
jgi:hypothetical protein